MQAPSSLTPGQRHTLESTYSCLKALSAYLEDKIPRLQPFDQLHARNLFDWTVLAISRLVEHFPEVAEWERRGGAR